MTRYLSTSELMAALDLGDLPEPTAGPHAIQLPSRCVLDRLAPAPSHDAQAACDEPISRF